MDHMLFSSVIKIVFGKKAIISSINNKTQITILRGDSKLVRGIPLHESGLLEKFAQGKLLTIEN